MGKTNLTSHTLFTIKHEIQKIGGLTKKLFSNFLALQEYHP